jgi:hypothetical protein
METSDLAFDLLIEVCLQLRDVLKLLKSRSEICNEADEVFNRFTKLLMKYRPMIFHFDIELTFPVKRKLDIEIDIH